MRKLALLVVTSIILGGCIQTTQAPAPTASPTSSVSPAAVQIDADTRVIEVTGNPFSFTPNVIRVKKGEKVAVKFVNAEGFHDFVIDELNVKTQVIAQGKSEIVMILTDTAGNFPFYCSVGDHRKKGMEGKLTVE